MAENITKEKFTTDVLQSTLPVIVDVYATWCGPCKMMTPVFDALAKELENTYKFVKINIDEERDLAIQYGISSIPAFLFIKNGTLVAKETGSMSKEALKAKIQTHLD